MLLLKVHAFDTPQKLYKSVDFNFGNYVTGVEGTLYYKSPYIVDFFVLETIGGSNVIDFLFILVCSILVYNTVSKITERHTFSRAKVKAFSIIAFVTTGAGLVKSLFDLFVARELLLYRTNNMFDLVRGDTNFYIIIGCPFLIFVYFIQQGNRLQEEQELTI